MIGDIIIIGGVPYDVIGTAQHRLWLQRNKIYSLRTQSSLLTPLREKEVEKEQDLRRNNHENKNDFIGLTRGTLDQILADTYTQIINKKDQFLSNFTKEEDIELQKEKNTNNYFPLFSKSNQDKLKDKLEEKNKVDKNTKWEYSDSVEIVRDALRKYQNRSSQWTRAEDETLVVWVECLSKSLDISPFDINPHTLHRSRTVIAALVMCGSEGEVTSQNSTQQSTQRESMYGTNDTLLAHTSQMYARHSDEEIEIRLILLIHMNDILLPLLPLLAPVDGSKVHIGGNNHPTQLLMRMRSLVFLSVTSEFTFKICSTHVQPSKEHTNTTVNYQTSNKIQIPIAGRSYSPAFSTPSSHLTIATGVVDHLNSSNTLSSFLSQGGLVPSSPNLTSVGVPPSLLNSTIPLGNNILPGTTSAKTISVTESERSARPLLSSSSNQPTSSFPSSSSHFNPHSIHSNIENEYKSFQIDNYGNNLVLEVEEEISISQEILFEFSNSPDNYQNNSNLNDISNNDNDSNNFRCGNISNMIKEDFICRLICGIKCSLIGQMMKYFGDLAQGKLGATYNNEKEKGIKVEKRGIEYGKEGSWENVLRFSCSKNTSWTEDLKSSKYQKIPFCIRMKENNEKRKNKKRVAVPTRLFSLLKIAGNVNQPSRHFVTESYKSVKSKSCITERNIFTVFVIQSFEQVNHLLNFLFF